MTGPTPRYRGLTWDHPRGRHALERAAATATDADGNPLIGWDAQPLEGFESAPIEQLAERYDVIVLDHPHLGDALAHDALQPWDELLEPTFLTELADGCVGPSFASYRMRDRLWALPLDAATQVAVRSPELLPQPPENWQQVAELDVPVAICLAGPHALMNVCSLAVGLGAEPRPQPGQGFLDLEAGVAALRLLAPIVAAMPKELAGLNPIGMLERMRRGNEIGYLPLVYGYVNYARAGEGSLIFSDVPAATPQGRLGSTIGGTGMALSRRCRADQELVDHLGGLLSVELQRGFIPDNDGQPSRREAWTDPVVNAGSADFYRGTLATIDDAWIRPRTAGYICFQAAASATIARDLLAGAPPKQTVLEINSLFDRVA